jgi:hypothetical protein
MPMLKEQDFVEIVSHVASKERYPTVLLTTVIESLPWIASLVVDSGHSRQPD